MMQSTYGGGGAAGSDDDDDMFAPNPFRSGGDSDLLGTPAPAPAMQQQPMQQQQPYMQQQQQQPPQWTQQQHPQQQQQYMQQQQPPPPPPQQQYMQQSPHRNSNIPDPGSGMTGSLQLPPPPLPQQQNPTQYLSGTMDQNARVVNSNNANNNYGSNDQNPPQSNSIFSWRFWTSCLRLDSYTTYFDMDTVDIAARLKSSVVDFYKPDHFRVQVVGHLDNSTSEQDAVNNPNAITGGDQNSPLYHKGPDLYGPVWISMTLVFLLAVTSNMAAYYHYAAQHRSSPSSGTAPADTGGNGTDTSGYTPPASNTYETDVEAFEYDLTHVVRGLSVVMTFAWILPTVFWLAAICLGLTSSKSTNDLTWVWWICCYGYSLTPLVAATALAWLPVLSWIVLGIATAMSGLLVLRNLSTPLLEGAPPVPAGPTNPDPTMQQPEHHHSASKAAPLILAIPATHFILACALKISFYSH